MGIWPPRPRMSRMPFGVVSCIQRIQGRTVHVAPIWPACIGWQINREYVFVFLRSVHEHPQDVDGQVAAKAAAIRRALLSSCSSRRVWGAAFKR